MTRSLMHLLEVARAFEEDEIEMISLRENIDTSYLSAIRKDKQQLVWNILPFRLIEPQSNKWPNLIRIVTISVHGRQREIDVAFP